jgi:glutamate 5-kinase
MEIVMFKKLALVSAVVLLSACSTVPQKKVEGPESVTAEFMGGDVKVTFNKDGEFEIMQSAGTARVTSKLPSAREEAFIIANMRAKQKIVEFMKNELEGDKFANTASESLQQSQAFTGLAANAEVNSKIAYSVQENIKSKSKAILQGVYVESKSFDSEENIVRVVVRTGAKDINVAKQIRSMMGN